MTAERAPRGASLLASYRGLICDLDGVVYRGSRALPGAVETLDLALGQGCRVAFATNNASRSPSTVMEHLQALGLDVSAAATGGVAVVTSAQAAAELVRTRVPAGSPILVVGGEGVSQAVAAVGLLPFRAEESREFPDAVAVVQGAGADVSWRDLAEAAFRVQAGALWVVTNYDRTLPTSRGLAPGNGALAEAVRGAVEVPPQIAGKPAAPLYQLALERLEVDPRDVLVVGDRLDTDIAGARTLGLDSMFVLGGVHRLADLAACGPEERPTHVGHGLGALLDQAPADVAPDVRLLVDADGSVVVCGAGSLERGELLGAVVRAAWRLHDEGVQLAEEPDAWRRLEEQIGVDPGVRLSGIGRNVVPVTPSRHPHR